MALTRKMLKAMGIEDEKIDQIIDAHSETVDGLKEKLRRAEEDAETLKDVQKELDDLKKKTDGSKDWEKKYNDEHKAFDDYKKVHEGDEQTIKELTAKNKEYETATLKSRIAHEVGLSYEWISRISGDDEQSIRSDAESLKKLVGSGNNVPIPTKSTETETPNAHNVSVKSVLNGIKQI